MVTCNCCRKNVDVEEIQTPFYYVCKECWKKFKIYINGEEINKDIIY